MTIVRREKRERSLFGKLIKVLFFLFNALMLTRLLAGLGLLSALHPRNDVEALGFFIGGAVGVTAILVIWVLGVIILGIALLCTRGEKVILEDEIGQARRKPIVIDERPTMDVEAVVERYVEQKRLQQEGRAAAPARPAMAPPSAARPFGRRKAI